MVLQNFKYLLFIYLAILGLMLFLSIRYKAKFWGLLGRVFPLLLAALVLFNLISFSFINQAYIHPAYRGHLERLQSNELIDLLENSASPPRKVWIYALVEDYYQGRVLLVPEELLDSLDLSQERLQAQGQLADLKTIDYQVKPTAEDMQQILSREYFDLNTIDGGVFTFVIEGADSNVPLLFFKYGNQHYFVPEDLLSDLESDL
jgi:hypothetical protein